MNAAGQLAVLVFTVAAAASATYLVKGPPQRTYVCDPATLKPGEICLHQVPADADILWIDARTRVEREKNGLAGSILWSLETGEDPKVFEAEIVPRILTTPRVIVYCGSEQCGLSHEVANSIKRLDIGADVSVLRGGWQALRDAGRVKDSNPGS